ncbi:spore germination protein [Paenibacillus sp. p3-SID867]|uniref:spore germination protein n=1 Tax=Paenibacillus sp. p3-SID867 TaxID=2916363 RepID=UPI0021A68622|nr:spore germination protein [Paenibacillus sp. p3-SID867]MCT1401783.1 spore germination protein [Paenibacillus sp. p3-SID867]
MKPKAQHILLDPVKERLANCEDVIYQSLRIHGSTCSVIYIESIVDISTLHEHIVKPLIKEAALIQHNFNDFIDRMDRGDILSVPFQRSSSADYIANMIVEGTAVVVVEQLAEAYLFDIALYQKRAVSESQNELVVNGPQEAFIEDIGTNLSLLRHKIKHTDLKTVRYQIGDYSKTAVYMVYIDGLCKPEVVAQVDSRLNSISIDGTFGISTLSEQMKEGVKSPFPQFQYTERPDSVAASLLEGRVGIMQDGTPSALIVPVTLFSLLQSSEDYYHSFFSSSWIRIVRFVFAVISLLMPSLYVAITTFQPSIIPTDLLITLAASRENIPFSALMEALIMELTFEALREAGTRIPKPVGQTISIIGAIVIGQAAVEAGVVSNPMVIVVSITGIASYIIPHFELGLAFRLLRFPILILGGTLGLIGVFAAAFLVYGHLASLKSFNTPYLQPIAPLVLSEWKDTFLRAPSMLMKKRPKTYASSNNLRRRKP